MLRTVLPFVVAATGPIRVVDIGILGGIVYVLVVVVDVDVALPPSATVTPASTTPGCSDRNSSAERQHSISRRVGHRRIRIGRRRTIDHGWIVGGNVNDFRIGLLNHDHVLAFDRLVFNFLLLAGF
jgi:hypothetical protein